MAGVEDTLDLFVYGELDSVERDRYCEGSGIRDVKGSEAFVAVDDPGTGEDRTKLGLVDLHTLFDDCKLLLFVCHGRQREGAHRQRDS